MRVLAAIPVALLLVALNVSSPKSYADSKTAKISLTSLALRPFAEWGKSRQGLLVTCAAIDRQGRTWVGTEDTGVWMYDPTLQKWTQFDSKTGLADDNCYALLCDSMGRIWAGTLNHGVSVYNGATWKNYDVLYGPLGARVFAMAENPIDHDIWIATENGLSRYSLSTGKWSYTTTADGLPSNQANALAFDKTGTLYVGTQCDGLGIASPADDYKTWQTVTGPLKPPRNADGEGLPSALINAVLAPDDGTVYVGTDSGLARSADHGKTWNYIRGADWAAKVKGEYPAPDRNLPSVANATLSEDYVTSLAEDASGNLWVGHRDKGIEVFGAADFKHMTELPMSAAAGLAVDDVSALVSTPAGVIIGTYGSGLLSAAGVADASDQQLAAAVTVPFPTPAASPSIADLRTFNARVNNRDAPMQPGDAAFLGDDWTTQGDWIGHYGRQYTILCAAGLPFDHEIGSDSRISKQAALGPHHKAKDALKGWVALLKTDNPKSLYDPIPGYRRQAEWNDNGETYPSDDEGPDIWVALTIPEGVFRFALYFFNDDGQSGSNRFRDYLVEIRSMVKDSEFDISKPPLAVARVESFRGGVYKSFVLCGPSVYYVRIARNYSFNAIVSGMMLDKLKGPSYFADKLAGGWMGGVHYDPPDPDVIDPPDPHLLDKLLTGQIPPRIQYLSTDARSEIDAGRTLWSSLNEAYDAPNLDGLQEPLRLLAYRSIFAIGAPDKLQANWRWYAHLWNQEDRRQFTDTMAKAHATLLQLNPQMNGVSF